MRTIEKYSCESIKAIENSSLLKTGDLEFIEKGKKHFQDIFEKRQIWRTETEINFSVLNDVKFPTPAAKYWQCIRESSIFFENLFMLSLDYKRTILKIKKIDRDIEKERDPLEREGLYIDKEEELFNKKNMEVMATDRVRELRIWKRKIDEIDDGSFDTLDVNSHQEISLAQKFIREFIVSHGSNASPAEKMNLVGQLQTSIDKLKKDGKIGLLYNVLTIEERKAFPNIKSDFTISQ